MMQTRVAVLVGCGKFISPTLPPLEGPANDVRVLSAVLSSKDVGKCARVIPLVDQTAEVVRRTLEHELRALRRGDLLVVHFSGHGILTARGNLCIAAHDTDPSLLQVSSIPMEFMRQLVAEYRDPSCVLLIDTCYAGQYEGAFSRVRGAFDSRNVEAELAAEGMYVLASCRGSEKSREGLSKRYGCVLGIFTERVVLGLETGAADRDQDGAISFDDLRVFVEGIQHDQEPTYSILGARGRVVVGWVPASKRSALGRVVRDRLVDLERIGGISPGTLEEARRIIEYPEDYKTGVAEAVTEILLRIDIGAAADALTELVSVPATSDGGLLYERVVRASEKWLRATSSPPMRHPKVIRDPIQGDVVLPDYLTELINHPLVRRLERLPQVSGLTHIYPTAHHTSLSHALGVMALVRRALEQVWSHGTVLTPAGERALTISVKEQERLIRLGEVCALLHEVSRPPWGLALDLLDPGNVRQSSTHAWVAEQYLAEAIRNVGLTTTEVVSLLDGGMDLQGWEVFLSQLLDSPMSLDRMDYIARDAFFTGILASTSPNDRLLSAIRPFKRENSMHLVFAARAVHEIERWFSARYSLSEQLYEHRDMRIVRRLRERLVTMTTSTLANTPDGILRLTFLDEEELADILMAQLPSTDLTCKSVGMVRVGTAPPYRAVGVLSTTSRASVVGRLLDLWVMQDRRRQSYHVQIEDQIAAKIGTPPGAVLIGLPRPFPDLWRVGPYLVDREDPRLVVEFAKVGQSLIGPRSLSSFAVFVNDDVTPDQEKAIGAIVALQNDSEIEP